MAPHTGALFVGELREYLARWDKASKAGRERMLTDFVKHSRNMTGPELEREFGNGTRRTPEAYSAWPSGGLAAPPDASEHPRWRLEALGGHAALAPADALAHATLRLHPNIALNPLEQAPRCFSRGSALSLRHECTEARRQ